MSALLYLQEAREEKCQSRLIRKVQPTFVKKLDEDME